MSPPLNQAYLENGEERVGHETDTFRADDRNQQRRVSYENFFVVLQTTDSQAESSCDGTGQERPRLPRSERAIGGEGRAGFGGGGG